MSITNLADMEAQLWADLLADENEYQQTRHPGVGPSDAKHLFPGGCVRQLAYRAQEVEKSDPDPGWVKHAVLGSAIHERIAKARQKAHPDWLIEHPLTIPGFDRGGTVDAYGDGTCDDVKTKTDRSFEWISETLGRATDADMTQVLIYGFALEAAGHDVDRCSVTYVNRNDGRLFVDSWTYDHDAALGAMDRMHGLIDLVDLVPADEQQRGGARPEWRPCDGCPWRTRCWNLPAPDGYSAVSHEMADEEVASDAEQLRLLRQQKAATDEAIEYLRARMEGHGGKRFTDSDGILREVRWSAGKPYGSGGALDQAAVRARYADLAEDPPTLGVAPRVTTPAVKAGK